MPRLQLDLFASALLTSSQPPPEQTIETPQAPPQKAQGPQAAGVNFILTGDRGLSSKWSGRAIDNIEAIKLSKIIEQEGRGATRDEQEKLMRFTGFGATGLQALFPVGDQAFKPGWETLGTDLRGAVNDREFAAIRRAVLFAHYTPEYIARALWRAVERLGFTGGSVLEPGCGTGLFPATAPASLDPCTFTGIENEPVTARIARLIHPQAKILLGDFTDPALDYGGPFDLAIGNPPFSDQGVRNLGPVRFSLHEAFIWRALQSLKPGGIGAFVVSRYLMDKGEPAAREAIQQVASLIAAIRLPEKAMRWAAGTDVVVDLVMFRRPEPGEAPHELPWHDTVAVKGVGGTPAVNRYFADHPEMVLGQHAIASSQYGPAYTCLPGLDALGPKLDKAIDRIELRIPAKEPLPKPKPQEQREQPQQRIQVRTVAEGATLREGSYLVNDRDQLCQIATGGAIKPVIIKRGRAPGGILQKHEQIIRGLILIRDATRAVLRAQEADQPWTEPLTTLQAAYQQFSATWGPINKTVITTRTRKKRFVWIDEETGDEKSEVREYESTSYSYPNLAPFKDPDKWLVASVEDYDIDTGDAAPGPIFTKRVVKPAELPKIETAHDALAVVLNECGKVNMNRIAELAGMTPEQAADALGPTVYLNPETEAWETADEYLSGPVRTKLAVAEAAAAIDAQYRRNVEALRENQPTDLRPTEITARLGAPWIGPRHIEQFCEEVLEVKTHIVHGVDLGTWDVDIAPFLSRRANPYGTMRRNAGQLLGDALNSRVPVIYDWDYSDGKRKQIRNDKETEAAKEKLEKIHRAFTDWVWRDEKRTDELLKIYNRRFNNLISRKFDGSHLKLANASILEPFYDHQKTFIWRVISHGTAYAAHVVGSGKTRAVCAAIMEQRRLGLVTKPMVVVPNQTLGQWAREWLRLYPAARLLVADESNFQKETRKEFCARAATGDWDAIIITHDAFKFIPTPADFEAEMIEDLIEQYADALVRTSSADRITTKRLEKAKLEWEKRLESLDQTKKDDLLTIAEMGVDQLAVDEFQAYRKLDFTTNNHTLKGVAPKGATRSWDMFVKTRYIDAKVNPKRALIAASGTPIANTMGELYSLQRYMDPEALKARGVHQFDAWVATFGLPTTELELQPSGKYKPVTRLSWFINVPELIAMFRERADVVLQDDIRQYLNLPELRTGQRQIITSEPTKAFKAAQAGLARRIKLIEDRKGPPKKGDDIILTVILDGRLDSLDLRHGRPHMSSEPGNVVNTMIDNVFRIWKETADREYTNPVTGKPYPRRGALQMVFSDISTPSMLDSRGFSIYLEAKRRLIELGVPAEEIAIVHDYPTTADKQRLWTLCNSGVKRIAIGSSEKMGTGTNAQQRLIALHHIDVPWMPYLIEQREGRIIRQGNQNKVVDIFAYALKTSMAAPMWQANERKLRFITAALKGDRSIRTMEDVGEDNVSQFRMAKAIASGDSRLMDAAGLESEIARLQRLYDSHIDEQFIIRRNIEGAKAAIESTDRNIPLVEQDIAARLPMEEGTFEITIGGRIIPDRKDGGAALTAELRKLAIAAADGTFDVGSFRGLPIQADGRRLSFDGQDGDYVLDASLQRAGGRSTSLRWKINTPAHVLIERLEEAVSQFENDLFNLRMKRAGAVRRLEEFEPRLGGTFDHYAELAEKKAKLERLQADLAANNPDLGAAA